MTTGATERPPTATERADAASARPEIPALNGSQAEGTDGAAENGWRCKCGAPRHPTVPDRCTRGHADMRKLGSKTHFPPGNMANLQHGLRAANLPPELAHLAADHEAFIAGCLVDEGEPDVPTRRRSLLSYRARLHRRIVQLDSMLELKGLLDKRGKLRIAWLQQLQSLVNAARGLDALLGLERQQKRVPSLAEVMRDDRGVPGGE